MKKALTRGQRAFLARHGINPLYIGRVVNKATLDVPVPKNADEVEQMLGDTATLKKIVKDTETLTEFVKAYGEGQKRTDASIEQQIKDETQRQFADILRGDQIDKVNRLNFAPEDNSRNNRFYNKKAPGAKVDQLFGNWADYFGATWSGANSQEAFNKRSELARIQNAFGSSVPADGGFLIPERLRAELLRVSLETAIVRQRARVVPMDSLTVPFPMLDSTSNASSVYGGVVGYWTEEGGALTDSAPKFGRIELTAKKLTLYSEIPNELFTDSIISLEAFMNESYPEAISWFEDVAFTSGNGVGQPKGFLNAEAAVSITKESGQSADTIVWENIVKMYARMLPSSLSRAVWVVNHDVFPELATMALSVGTGGSAVWIGDGNGADAPPMRILGRPVISTEKVPTLGDAGDINFVDFGYYLLGDRQAMQAQTSTEYKFGNDKTAVRVIERVDGQPWIKSAITPKTGSNTLSPFVKTEARA